jgi:hypothetical protein
MHWLNSQKYITNDFYDKPNSSRSVKIEYLYNKLFGVIPTLVGFSDQFELASLEAIKEHFELFNQDLNVVGDKLLEESAWIGKANTDYADAMLFTQYRSDGTASAPGMGNIDLEISDLMEGVFSPTDAADKISKSNIYVSVRAACKSKEQASHIIKLVDTYKIIEKSKIYILSNSYGELDLTALPVEPLKTDLELNYGKTFAEFHDRLVDSLNNKTSGLYLFYGEPGTGKSSYIKYLLNGEVKRKIAYIPIGLIDRLISPDFLPILISNKDLILVMEDAEKALLSRDSGESNTDLVSAILNLTDGFLGQAMNISVIATFNTAKDRIDSALLRKGRLRMSHEFKKLSLENAKNLAESMGISSDMISSEMSLADIYYINENSGYAPKEEKRIGFN